MRAAVMARRGSADEAISSPPAFDPSGFAAALAYLRVAHWPARICERTDHATEIAAAVQREAEASADAIVGLIDAILDGLELSPEDRERGASIAMAALERLAAPTPSPDRELPTPLASRGS